MADYIEREDALEYIKSVQCRTCSDIGLCGGCAVLVAVRLLEKVPAADAVEVVRCKECRHMGKELGKGIYSCNDYNLPYCEPDGFCSHGKRRNR